MLHVTLVTSWASHKYDVQAGNKSALTYRCDIGVPGYTGFIPQTAAIPLQVKGSTKYIGRQNTEPDNALMASELDPNRCLRMQVGL